MTAGKGICEGKPTRAAGAVCSHARGVALFVSSADFTDSFVARSEEHNCKQGQDEREDSCNSPGPENNAQVLGRPREQHLLPLAHNTELMLASLKTCVHRALPFPHIHVTVVHTTMTHV